MKITAAAGGASTAVPSNGAGLNTFLSSLPPWLTVVIGTLAVLLIAALAGHILGRIYCAVRYPDPGKRSVLSVRQRFLFLGVILSVCAVLIFAISSMAKEKTASADGKNTAGVSGSPRQAAVGKAYLK